MSLRFYAVDLDEDVRLFATAEEARACAEEVLDEACAESRTGNGWPETTGAIRWGEVGEDGQRVVREHARLHLDHEHTDACQPEPDPDDDPDECTEGYGLEHDVWGRYELVAADVGAHPRPLPERLDQLSGWAPTPAGLRRVLRALCEEPEGPNL